MKKCLHEIVVTFRNDSLYVSGVMSAHRDVGVSTHPVLFLLSGFTFLRLMSNTSDWLAHEPVTGAVIHLKLIDRGAASAKSHTVRRKQLKLQLLFLAFRFPIAVCITAKLKKPLTEDTQRLKDLFLAFDFKMLKKKNLLWNTQQR